MTIRLKGNEFDEQFQEADEEQLQWDASDELDIIYKSDTRITQGWRREIELREGIELIIDRHQLFDHLILKCSETEEDLIGCIFTLSGKGQLIVPSTLSKTLFPRIAGKYTLSSNGLSPQYIIDESDIVPYCHLLIFIHPSILRSFAPSLDGELPLNLKHLVRYSNLEQYIRSGEITPMMTTVLQQILNCPYQGLIKRAYLESKVIELMALVLAREVAIGQGEVKKVSLKPEQIERIHYAKEILLRDLSNPPSLEDLARQAGLNDFMLKQGFHHCFGTTVFRLLRDHRLEIAKQLLAERSITVEAVAHQVGYASVRSFARAFKSKFTVSPKAYQKACR